MSLIQFIPIYHQVLTTVATIECTKINSKIIQKTINLKTYKKTYQNHIRLRLFIIDLVIFEEFQLKRHFAIDKLPIELPIQSIQIQDAKFHPNVSNNFHSNRIRVYVCFNSFQQSKYFNSRRIE